jgi:hypothetical protein
LPARLLLELLAERRLLLLQVGSLLLQPFDRLIELHMDRMGSCKHAVHAQSVCMWVMHVQAMLCTIATDALQPAFEAASPGNDLHTTHGTFSTIAAVGSCHNRTAML